MKIYHSLVLLVSLVSCTKTEEQPQVQTLHDSTPAITRIGDSLVILGNDTFTRLVHVKPPTPPVAEIKPPSPGDVFIGTYKCIESFCSDHPYTLTIRQGDGDYLVTLDKNRDNMEGAARTFPMRYDAGLLTYSGGFGAETIEFRPGSDKIISFDGKLAFSKVVTVK